jgi:ribose 5-phosphate isomerase B
VELAAAVVAWLRENGTEVIDLRPPRVDPTDDYPDRAKSVGEAVRDGQAERGIIICGSGVGANIAANKIKGVRAAICHDTYSAHQGVEHDEMNVLCLGSMIVGREVAMEIVRAFVGAKFTGEERHVRRLNKVLAIEAAG